jgi:formylglycine-generating enzyme required for sulfatase activity
MFNIVILKTLTFYIYLFTLILLFMFTGCYDATETAQACAEEISELEGVCPVGTSAVLRAQADGSCDVEGSADFWSMSGELSGSCKSKGSCDFVCLIQPDRCTCGIESFTNNEVICKPCAACGDGICSDAETPNTCPRDCAEMCQLGSFRCNGTDRQQCSEQGNWESLPCPQGESCREGEDIVMCGIVCEVGMNRCNGDLIQECSQQGVWESLACSNEERCVSEGGEASCQAICEFDATRCNGNMREVCSDAGTWESLACPQGESCVTENSMAECQPIQSCGTVGDTRCLLGNRESCTADGLWAAQPCDSNSRCDDSTGEGQCIECTNQWWIDVDMDLFGDPLTSVIACEQPDGYVAAGGEIDCDDSQAHINPNQREICDRQDNNCNQEIDEVGNAACGIGEYCENGNECQTGYCDFEFNVCTTGTLIVIPGGLSPNGSNVSGVAIETPMHNVRISRAYLMQRYEVTNADWNAIFDRNPSAELGVNQPVQNVSWYDALAYANALSQQEGTDLCYDLSDCEGTPGVDFSCNNISESLILITTCFGYRLPTEAEWEHASRGGSIGWFSGHWIEEVPNDQNALETILDVVGWYAGNSRGPSFGRMRPQDVGTKDLRVNAGDWQLQINDLYDTHGNIAEWTWDFYTADAYQNRLTPCQSNEQCDGVECSIHGFCNEEVIDPIQQSVNGMSMPRVVRGGAYDSSAFECRHASRRGAERAAHNIGFRLVRSMIQ